MSDRSCAAHPHPTAPAEGRADPGDAPRRDARARRPDPDLIALAEADALTPAADLAAQQALLEAAGAALGARLFRARLTQAEARGAAAHTPFGRRALRDGLDALTAAVEAAKREASWEAASRPAAAAEVDRLLALVDPELAAWLTLRAVIEIASEEGSATRAAQEIADQLEDEARYAALRDRDPATVAALLDEASGRETAGAARRLFEAGAAAAGAPARNWRPSDKERLGLALIDLALTHAPFFELVEPAAASDADPSAAPAGRGAAERASGGGREPYRLRLCAAAAAQRETLSALAAIARPRREPMIVPPRDWAGPRGGGYRTAELAGTLIKQMLPQQDALLRRAEAEIFYRAVNAAQATAWRVNARVLDVIRALDKTLDDAPAAETRAGVPAAHPAARPEAPEHRRFWRIGEKVRRSRRFAFERMLQTARRYHRFERIYLPAEVDFRGRLYAAPDFNPQGPDMMRALFEFADAKPLGPEGWKWLAIHLANCGDFNKISKAPLSHRAEWTLAQEERILAAAADPLAERWWMEADKPWQFLAACFEWEAYRSQGEDALSRLPIALDGSCSGIQHFALALRDEAAGAAVNLTPQLRSADIYSEVAEATRDLLEADLAKGLAADADGDARTAAALARIWLEFGVDRGVCKRPTMTYGYGARRYGYTDQILADTLRPARQARGEADWPFAPYGDVAAARYLAARLTEAIEQVVLCAARGMAWLQEIVGAADGPVVWTTPDGFPVRQAYPKTRPRRVSATVTGKLRRFNLREATGMIDRRRQRQGVAPNFVHSLDATHLRLTVCRALEEGIDAFQLVHDSFGVHAADTPRFFQIVREAMVEMYDAVDVIARFHDEIAEQLPDEARRRLPPPPARGALALAGVLESEFCFS